MSKSPKSELTADQRLDAIVAEARALREAKESADARFLLFLLRAERDEKELLESCGFGSFAQFLKSNELCDPARFENFKAGVAHVGEEEAERIGANPTIALAQTRDRGKVAAFVNAVGNWSDTRGGVKPTLETAQRLLRQVDPRPEVPRDTRRLTRLEQLERENAQLRTENARLKRENEKLKRDVAKRAA